MRNRHLAFFIVTLLAGVAAALLAAHGTWGVANEWQWEPPDVERSRWWMPTLPSLALIGFSMWLLRRARREGRVAPTWVLLFVLLAFVLQLSTLATAPASTVFSGAVVLSPEATTYFAEAGKIEDMREFLQDYALHMRAFSQHAQTYPPGPIVFFWGIRQMVEDCALVRELAAAFISGVTGCSMADVAGAYALTFKHPVTRAEAVAAILSAWLLGFLGCLSILPIYFLARQRWGDHAAVCAAALSAAVPSLMLFTPSILQLVTLETALALYLFHLAWSRCSMAWGVAAGAMWAVAALTSLAMLALLPLLVVWAAFERFAGAKGEGMARKWWRVIPAWLGGAGAVLALAYLAVGIDFPAIVGSALGAHRDVTTRAFARTYWRWLGWNLFDFWMFLGAGLGLWLLRQMWGEVAALARGQKASVTPLLWALALTLAALDLSGVVRAEVGRIWMFLMLPAAMVAGRYVASGRQPEAALGIVLVAQLIQISTFERHLALFVVR